MFYPLLNKMQSAFDNSSSTLLGERIDWQTVLALVEPRLTVYMVTVVIMSVCAQSFSVFQKRRLSKSQSLHSRSQVLGYHLVTFAFKVVGTLFNNT